MQYRKNLLLAALLISFNTVTAHASLTTTDNGLGIYDSVSNITWSSDNHLLGTLEAQQGSSTIINSIIAANGGVIQDTPNSLSTGTHILTAGDFYTDGCSGCMGLASWWGQRAFAHYLNTINYGNSSQWTLPTTNQYIELVNQGGEGILKSTDIGRVIMYWTGTELSQEFAYNIYLYDFPRYGGLFTEFEEKGKALGGWVVSPGQLSSVPLPGAVWLFGTGILGLLRLKRRRAAG